MSVNYNDVINRIKEERARLGLTQNEMARYVCINQSAFNKVEQGTRRFNYSELKYLCDSPIDVYYVITGKKCGEKYKECFSRYEYEQLVNIMNIVSSVMMGVDEGELSGYWKTICVRIIIFKVPSNATRFTDILL